MQKYHQNMQVLEVQWTAHNCWERDIVVEGCTSCWWVIAWPCKEALAFEKRGLNAIVMASSLLQLQHRPEKACGRCFEGRRGGPDLCDWDRVSPSTGTGGFCSEIHITRHQQQSLYSTTTSEPSSQPATCSPTRLFLRITSLRRQPSILGV